LKLVRYRQGKTEQFGALTVNGIVCLPRLARRLHTKFPRQLEQLIILGRKGIEIAERLLENASEKDVRTSSLPLSRAKLLAPVASPPKIVCLGLNYRDHAAEQNVQVPDEPVIFMKPHTTIIGPYEDIAKPSFVRKLDYEAELAIAVGRKAKNISAKEAKSYIFGYMILNDVSARDIQFKDRQWTRGKSFDTFAPTGPCITTENQLEDTSNLCIRTWVNDQLRQNSTTKNMVFDVCETVHQLSRVMTLEPCDIIATGTPAGVGFAMKPKPRFLRSGDTVRIEIEKIGILENGVVEKDRTS
jgi:2-keto-4-pentenoate hydratase/2-oxohepta-3-ene-1,7-dioic acid hydratase in catechol pathway